MADENVLKMPEGVSSQGPVQDISEASLRALVALPEILINMTNVLNEIAGSLDTVALYTERKGLKEEYLSPEDLVDNDAEEGGEYGNTD